MYILHLKSKKQPLADVLLFQMFFKRGVIKNVGIFTGKHLCWSLLLIVGLDNCNFIRNRFQTPEQTPKFFRTYFFNRAPPVDASERRKISPNYSFVLNTSYSLMNFLETNFFKQVFLETNFSNRFFIHKNYVQNIHCLALMRHG